MALDPHHQHTALYIGEVVDNQDPEKLGRVRVRIPGLVEPASAWAFPLGTVGGGSGQRGFFAVPELHAECGVMFKEGDVDHPYYWAGHWGRPNGMTEVPTPVQGVSKSDTPQVRAFETPRFVLTFDDRAGNEAVVLHDKRSGDVVRIDGDQMGILIKGTSAVLIQSDGLVSIQGTVVQLNGRVVLPGTKPI